jgi:hypothetical protein
MSVPLYELTAQYRELQLIAEDPSIDVVTLKDTLEGIEGAFQEKAKAVAAVIRNLSADAQAIDDAAAQMKKRSERLWTSAENLKTYLLVNMLSCQCRKIASPYFTITVRKNPPYADVTDAAAVPEEFKFWPDAPPRQINKRALLDALGALDEGKTIPGAKLGQTKRVEIRP